VLPWGQVSRCGATLFYQWAPADLTNAIAIAASTPLSSVALRADGTVVVWGCGAVNPPVGLSGVTAVCLSRGDINRCYFALSDVAQPVVPVSILLAGPVSQIVGEGSQPFFSVSAAGPPPLTYQWYFGSNVVAGATNRWLNLTNVQFSQAGSYTVKVSAFMDFFVMKKIVRKQSLFIWWMLVTRLNGLVGDSKRR